MLIIASTVVALYVTGAVIVMHGLATAPEGFQDETGFNLLWRNDRADVPNVTCIWETGHFAAA